MPPGCTCAVFRAALFAIALRGALAPVFLRAVYLVRAIGGIKIYRLNFLRLKKSNRHAVRQFDIATQSVKCTAPLIL